MRKGEAFIVYNRACNQIFTPNYYIWFISCCMYILVWPFSNADIIPCIILYNAFYYFTIWIMFLKVVFLRYLNICQNAVSILIYAIQMFFKCKCLLHQLKMLVCKLIYFSIVFWFCKVFVFQFKKALLEMFFVCVCLCFNDELFY